MVGNNEECSSCLTSSNCVDHLPGSAVSPETKRGRRLMGNVSMVCAGSESKLLWHLWSLSLSHLSHTHTHTHRHPPYTPNLFALQGVLSELRKDNAAVLSPNLASLTNAFQHYRRGTGHFTLLSGFSFLGSLQAMGYTLCFHSKLVSDLPESSRATRPRR